MTMLFDDPELSDPEYGPRLEARARALQARIEAAGSRPDALLREYDALMGTYAHWRRCQQWIARRRKEGTDGERA